MTRRWAVFVGILCFTIFFPQLVEAQDDVASILYNEGLRKYILKDYQGAVGDFESAYRLDQQNLKIKNMYLNALIKQANLEYEQNNLKSAQDYFVQALELSGGDAELQRKLSLIRDQIDVRTAAEPELPEGDTVSDIQTAVGRVEAEKQTKTTALPPVIQVEMPFDIEEFIRKQNEENNRILNEIIESQKAERENLFRNMELIAQSQQEDRRYFSRSLIIVLAGAGGIVFIPLLVIVLLVAVRRRSLRTEAVPATAVSLANRPELLLESTRDLDDTKYVTDEHYTEIVRAKRLRDLYQELVQGNLTWDVVSEYIGELNHDLKAEILTIVEDKIEHGNPSKTDNVLPVLMPLITDAESDISARSRELTARVADKHQAYSAIASSEYTELQGSDDPFNLATLVQIARLIDNKSGILGHSVNVGEIAYKIAEALNDSKIEPFNVQKVGLVHNIGYLDIPDHLFKLEGALTEEQFEIIKSHPERGIKLFEYTNPPEIFVDGIRYHHERLDGSGYPEGRQGGQIPLIARVIAVADSFAAATAPRPFRKALSVPLCLEMMKKVAGSLLDADIVGILSDLFTGQTIERS